MTVKKGIITIEQSVGLWMILRRTVHLVGKSRQRELTKYDISDDAAAVLFTVSFLGRQSIPATISKYLFLERHSVSQLLTRMEKDDLVRRVKDLERKNYVRIELTARGHDVLVKSSKLRSTKSIISVLTEEEQKQTWSYMIRLRERAIKKLVLRGPLFYPPSDRQEVIDNFANTTGQNYLHVDPATALWMLIDRTSRLIGKARQRELAKYGVSVDASAVIFTVYYLGHQAIPATISRQLFLERHSVSQLLTRMEKDGLIRRVKDLERRNYVRIELTVKGWDVLQRSGKHQSVIPIISVLSENEQQELWIILAKVRNRAIKRLGLKNTAIYPPSDPIAMSKVI